MIISTESRGRVTFEENYLYLQDFVPLHDTITPESNNARVVLAIRLSHQRPIQQGSHF